MNKLVLAVLISILETHPLYYGANSGTRNSLKTVQSVVECKESLEEQARAQLFLFPV